MKNVLIKVLLVAMIATTFIPLAGPARAVPATVTLTVTPGCGFNTLKWTDTDQAYQFEPRLVLDDGSTYPIEDFPLVGKYEYKHENLENGKQYCYVIYSLDKDSNKITQSNKACGTPVCQNQDCTWKCGCLEGLVPTAANVVKFNEGCKDGATPVYLNFSATLTDLTHGWTIDQYLKICIEKGTRPCVTVCIGPNNNIVQWKADVEGNDCCKPEIPKPVIECYCIKITEVECSAAALTAKGTDSDGTPWCLEGLTANLCGTLKVGSCYKICGEVIPPGPNEKWSCKRLKVSSVTEGTCDCTCICLTLTRVQCQGAATNVPWPLFFGTDDNGNQITAVIQDSTILDLNGNVVNCADIKPETCWKLCGFWRVTPGAVTAFVVLQAQQVPCPCKPNPTNCCQFKLVPKIELPICLKAGQQFSFYFDVQNFCDKEVTFDVVISNTTPGATASVNPTSITVLAGTATAPGIGSINVIGAVPVPCQTLNLVVSVYQRNSNCPPAEYKISIPCCTSGEACCKYDVKQKTEIPDCIKPGEPFNLTYDIINYCPDNQDFTFAYNVNVGGVSPIINPMVLTVPGMAATGAPGSAPVTLTFNPSANCTGDISVTFIIIPKNAQCPKKEITIRLKCCGVNTCCQYEIKRMSEIQSCLAAGEKVTVRYRLYNTCNPCTPIPFIIVPGSGVTVNVPAGTPGTTAVTTHSGTIPCGTNNFADVSVTFTMPKPCKDTVFMFVISACGKRTPVEVKIPCCQPCCKFDIKRMNDIPSCLKAGEKATVRYRLFNTCNPCTPIPFSVVPGSGVTINVPAGTAGTTSITTHSGIIPCGTNNYADVSVTFTMPNPCKDSVFTFYIVACDKRTPVEVKIPCCSTGTTCCKYEVKQLTQLPDCVKVGQSYSVKYEIDNFCDKPAYFLASAQGNVAVTMDPVHSITVPAMTTSGVPGKATFTLNFTVKECKELVTITLVVAPMGTDCPKKTIVIKIKCCPTEVCCDYSIKLLSELPECVKPGQKYELKLQVCNNCKSPITLALTRCPGTTGLIVNPSTVTLGPVDSLSHCMEVTVTIWADENMCKQNNGIIEYCLMTQITSPTNCGDKGVKQHKIKVRCCGYEPQNCCEFDVSPLNTPPTELAPGGTFIAKYQVANKGDRATCAPLNMTIKNIQPAGALVILPTTFTIPAGGFVNLDVKIIMPACTSPLVSFSFEVWFEGCEKPAIVKFDVNCTEGCKLNLMYKIKSFDYWKNGEFVETMPVYPEIRSDMNDRSFLVIRYVTKHLNASIAYDATQKMVTIVTAGGKKILLWIGKTKAVIDGKEVAIDPTDTKGTVKPYISGAGYTMLPLRFVSDQLGAKQVKWHGDTQIAELIFDCPQETTQPVPMGFSRSFSAAVAN